MLLLGAQPMEEDGCDLLSIFVRLLNVVEVKVDTLFRFNSCVYEDILIIISRIALDDNKMCKGRMANIDVEDLRYCQDSG